MKTVAQARRGEERRSLPKAAANFSKQPVNSPALTPQSGVMLVECLVYIAVWFVVAGLAFSAFFRVLDNAKRVRRNANDIARVLQAGEIWRDDIRKATGPIALDALQNNAEATLRIPQTVGEIAYRFTGSNVLRRTGAEAPWTVALGTVTASSMIRDRREQVSSWRWEVELKVTKNAPLKRPLFSFQAVPTRSNTP